MKILHTADLHLKDKGQVAIVKAIVGVAIREEVDLIIVAGDLFDSMANGRSLEAILLPIWEAFPGTVLVVPGNHDYKYLKNRDELAPNVVIAHKLPYSIAEIQGIYFVCVPYQDNKSFSDIKIPFCDPSVLITHGTFGVNNRKDSKYFPIQASDVLGKYRYVALGHYHTWFDKWVDGVLVVNPGSPRQTRKSDKGVRYISIVDTESWVMERIVLPISFVEYKTIHLSITDSEEEIKEYLLQSTLLLKDHGSAEVSLILKGSVIFNQYALSQRVQSWKNYLTSKGIDESRVRWDLSQIIQISPKIIYAGFTKLLIDHISRVSPQEVNELASFLFERLQQENQEYIE